MKLKLSQKALLLVVVPLVCQLAFLGWLSFLLDQSERDLARQAHARAVTEELNGLLRLVLNSAAGVSGFTIAQDDGFVKRYEHASDAVPDKIAQLKKLTQGNAEETKFVNEIEAMINECVDRMRGIKDSVQKKSYLSALKTMHDMKPLFLDMYAKFDEAAAMEQKVEQSVPESAAAVRDNLRQELWVAALGSLLVAIAVTLAYNRSTTARLATLMDNTHRFALGKPLLPVTPGHDEIAHLDKVFHEMADSVEEAQRMKQQFVSIVSHELRTPLMNAQGILTLLEAGAYGALTPEGLEQVGVASRSTDRVMVLINDLLIIDKLESGMVDIVASETELDQILGRSVEMVRSLSEKKKLKVEVQIDTKSVVYADCDRLVQVLTNLLSNAVKFSDKETTIMVSACDLDGNVRIAVRDQGRGIPADQQSRIFDRYTQVQGGDSKVGTGLGLAICKAIIEKHGGKIGVSSEPGEGAEFWFELPAISQAVELGHDSVTNPA